MKRFSFLIKILIKLGLDYSLIVIQNAFKLQNFPDYIMRSSALLIQFNEKLSRASEVVKERFLELCSDQLSHLIKKQDGTYKIQTELLSYQYYLMLDKMLSLAEEDCAVKTLEKYDKKFHKLIHKAAVIGPNLIHKLSLVRAGNNIVNLNTDIQNLNRKIDQLNLDIINLKDQLHHALIIDKNGIIVFEGGSENIPRTPLGNIFLKIYFHYD